MTVSYFHMTVSYSEYSNICPFVLSCPLKIFGGYPPPLINQSRQLILIFVTLGSQIDLQGTVSRRPFLLARLAPSQLLTLQASSLRVFHELS